MAHDTNVPETVPTITVIVSGGVVQCVTGIPAGIRVVVQDYDCDGCDVDGVLRDANGDTYVQFTFE